MTSEDNYLEQTSISQGKTIKEIADFWDNHSVADYWDETHEVAFDVRAVQQHRVAVDPEIYAKLEEQAQSRGILPETLVNLWLAERLTVS